MKYNKDKHLNLLKYSQKLESEDKHIYDELEKDWFLLRKYTVILLNNLNFQNREQCFELIEQF